MSDSTDVSQTSNQNASRQRYADAEVRRRLREHHQGVRFHLSLNIFLILAATAVLKSDGPYFADGLSAGIYTCGLALSLFAFRSVHAGETNLRAAERDRLALDAESDYPDKPRVSRPSAATLFVILSVFFLAAACATVYYSFVAPVEQIQADEDGVAWTVMAPPEAC